MTLRLTPETWAQVRYEYEHTDKPVDEICLDHGVSGSTLRDRVRRWRWTPRHEPVPAEGPPPMLPVQRAAPLVPAMRPVDAVLPAQPAAALPNSAIDSLAPAEFTATPDGADSLPSPPAPGEETPPDPATIVPRLQSAVARVLPAIEATVAQLAAGPMPPREMERAVRTLASLIRTLRELNELLSQHQPQPGARRLCDCDMPEDIDEFRIDLARRIEAFVASQPDDEGAPPQGHVPHGA